MKLYVLTITVVLALTGCESRYPKYYEYGQFGFSYDDVGAVPGLTDRVAKRANLTLSPKTNVVCEPKPDPDTGVITFYQAPGTPPAETPALWYAPSRPAAPPPGPPAQYPNAYPPGARPPVPGGSSPPNPGPSGYAPYDNSAASPYAGYAPNALPYSYSYSDSEVIFPRQNGFDPSGTAGSSPSGGTTPTIGIVPTPGFNPVPGARNSGDIPRTYPVPPGEPPGTALIPNRPFSEPPGTELHTSYGVGTPPVSRPPVVQQPVGQLTPPTAPFAPAVNPFLPTTPAAQPQSTVVQPVQPVQPMQPAQTEMPIPLEQPAIPARPTQRVQPVLPGAVPIPHVAPHGGGGRR